MHLVFPEEITVRRHLAVAPDAQRVRDLLCGAAVALLVITLILARQSPSKVPAGSSSLEH